MKDLLEIFGENEVYLVRLVVAMVLGGLVGMERQSRGRAAGLRTNILVCLGSAAIIVAFQKLSVELNVGAESAVRMDPARAAAGVITGIGFLGAGTIIKSKNFVRGLTTAASIWVVSTIGVTVGLGEYFISSTLTVLVLIALFVLHKLPISGDRYYTLQLKWTGDLQLLDETCDWIDQHRATIKSRALKRKPDTGSNNAKLMLRIRNQKHADIIMNEIQIDTRFDEVNWS